jgi:hypothetical protein
MCGFKPSLVQRFRPLLASQETSRTAAPVVEAEAASDHV